VNEEQLRETLRRLAHYVVRNEIVCEHFLKQETPIPMDEIGAKVREVDEHLKEHTAWQNRFSGLFPSDALR
jgi:Mn-dependent DtxR family transcriptional regulator